MAGDSTHAPGGSAAAPQAVLLDALGTLVRLEPPAPRLRRALREQLGIEVDEATSRRAVAAEIAYYREHLDRGRDAASLAALRRDSAAVMGAQLPDTARDAGLAALTDVLLAALEFTPFPDVVPALRALRARGAKLVVVSNWDVSLHEVLARTGLAGLVDGALASAELGVAKPDPAIFARALELAGGAEPAASRHVGDSPEADVAGARAAGITPILITRDAPPPPGLPAGVRVISSLADLA
jgi:putative hydrolase of the HAD superfamily